MGEFLGAVLGMVLFSALAALLVRIVAPVSLNQSFVLGVTIMSVVGGWLYSQDGYLTFHQAWLMFALAGVLALPILIVTAKPKKARKAMSLSWSAFGNKRQPPNSIAKTEETGQGAEHMGRRVRSVPPAGREETLQANPAIPSIQVDADEHPAYGARRLELIPERGRRQVRSNFFAQYWRGEFSLGASYWGVNFLVNLALVTLAGTLTVLFSPEEGFEPVSIFFFTFLLWLGLAVLVVWQLVGLWRSASRDVRRKCQANKYAFWAGAAQLAAMLGVLQSLNSFTQNAAPQIIELYRIAFQGDPDIPSNELKLLSGGTELSVFGGIKYGLSNDVERLLNAAPEVSVVHLTSSGGRIAEANKLFKLIKERGLNTYVSNECSSACTLIFAAGTQRSLLEGAS